MRDSIKRQAKKPGGKQKAVHDNPKIIQNSEGPITSEIGSLSDRAYHSSLPRLSRREFSTLYWVDEPPCCAEFNQCPASRFGWEPRALHHAVWGTVELRPARMLP
ncbi:hypothetical protein CIHG_02507 [Coccidioides immitis H538.4]|uniref:Uncharacterized protein n=1 Tax=Coccidioides immitis H538.4 TaxID=396776 RepID=A0A0J8UC16_COCIT|nr:hypothetical protein CIHG_02507 [Coccidioides immitis H538.4]